MLVCALLFLAVTALGFFRLQSSRLEQILNGLERRIEMYSSEELELQLDLSRLVSPIQIYEYWKNILGMDKAKRVEVIRVFPSGAAKTGALNADARPEDAAGAVSGRGWRLSFLSFFGASAN
jgi:hypothetical protein